MRLTNDQLMALADLVKTYEADEIHVASACDHTLGARLDVDLYRFDEQHWHINAVILADGEVRESVLVQ